MQKLVSCSFHSGRVIVDDRQLQAKQQQILQQYESLYSNMDPAQYSQQILPYSQLPRFVTQQIKSLYSQCIYLDRFTFYQMFTMLIVQYLFKNINKAKINKIKNLKTLICQPTFLEGSIATKALIIKGLKLVQQVSASNSKQFVYPLGQCLLNCDSICAFTQCWKELASRICKQNKVPVMTENDIDSSIFQIFGTYFQVQFDVYWKQKGNKLWKQHFTFSQAKSQSDKLSIVVNPDYQISISQRCIKISQSGISGMSGQSSSHKVNHSWNYLILTNWPTKSAKSQKSQMSIIKCQLQAADAGQRSIQKIANKAQMPNGEQISRISQIQYSCGETEEIKILLEQKIIQNQTVKKMNKPRNPINNAQEAFSSILATMGKANVLIQQMKKYSEYLQSYQTNEIKNNLIF